MPSREAIVEVTLTDGTQLSEHVKDVRGTTENPMTREEVVAKARDLMTPILGAEKCGKLIDRVLELVRTHPTAAGIANAAQKFGQSDDISVISVTRTAVAEPALVS